MASFTPENILVPVDFSDFSREALETAVSIAGEQNGMLTVLHVMEEPTPPPGYEQASAVYRNWAQMKDDIEKRSAHVLEALMDEAGGSRSIEHLCIWGDPVDEIVKMAEAGDFDLVAMSTHGRTGLDRLMMGSVAERVLRHVTKPVLLIPRRRESSSRKVG